MLIVIENHGAGGRGWRWRSPSRGRLRSSAGTLVAGNDDRAALVAARGQLKEEVGALAVDRLPGWIRNCARGSPRFINARALPKGLLSAHRTGAQGAQHGVRTAAPERCDSPFDQGSQYTSLAFGKRCDEAGVRPSMGSVGDCLDNAMCESFVAMLECELLDRRRFKTQIY